MNLQQIKRESEQHTKKLVEEARKKEIVEFNADSDVEHLPYDNPNLIFERQGTRIIWMSRGDRYCSARYYPNEETAEQVIRLIKERQK